MKWKDINGFEGKYQISEDGRVRSIGRVVKNKCGTMTVNERILKPWIDTWGYKNVCLCNDGKRQSKKVHRLIAEAFVPPYSGEQVNHIDGDKLNNYASNLEWCTRRENTIHAYRNGLQTTTRCGHVRRVVCLNDGHEFSTAGEAARYYGLDVGMISSQCRRKSRGRELTFRFI